MRNWLTQDIFAERSLRRLCGSPPLGAAASLAEAHFQLSTLNFQLFWALGDGEYRLYNGNPPAGSSGNYNYWTANGTPTIEENPPTASLPVKNTPSLTAKTQILPASGERHQSTGAASPGTVAYYLSSTPANATAEYRFYLTASEFSNSTAPYGYGFSIRCVRP